MYSQPGVTSVLTITPLTHSHRHKTCVRCHSCLEPISTQRRAFTYEQISSFTDQRAFDNPNNPKRIEMRDLLQSSTDWWSWCVPHPTHQYPFTQSCVWQSSESRTILAWGQWSLLRMLLSYPIMTLSQPGEGQCWVESDLSRVTVWLCIVSKSPTFPECLQDTEWRNRDAQLRLYF